VQKVSPNALDFSNRLTLEYSDNRSNSRANNCNKPRLLEGMHLLDKRSTLPTPRRKPSPPKTVSPMPEAGFLAAVVLSMPGLTVEPLRKVKGELGPPSGEPVL
jgi:hypothetical protein